MALPKIRIDDRTFQELLNVLVRQLPPDYSDHNPSDPLIAVIELLSWLGEMSLYRMDRVSPEHEALYLELLVDRPVAVTVPVVFTATYGLGGAHDIGIPAGTRVATDFDASGRRSVFETVEPVTIGDADPGTNAATATAREYLEVRDERLGVAEGRPNESFRLTPVHARLGIPADAVAPVLFDDAHRGDEYDPNPRVRTFRGMRNAVAGPLSTTHPVTGVRFDTDPAAGPLADEHYLLTFAPLNLRLTRGDGAFEDAAVSAAPIPAGGSEDVSFPGFGAVVTLGPGFDKATALTVAPATATVTGGTGAINAASVQVVSTEGGVDRITGTTLTALSFADPTAIQVVLDDGYTGSLDASAAGATTVELTGPDGDRITIGLVVTSAFDGNETAAAVTLPALGLLLVFGGERWVAHHSVRTERSATDGGPHRPRHLMLRPDQRTVHFGDGVYGALPVAGAVVVCERYQLLLGPPNLVEAGEILHLLDPVPGLAAADAVVVGNVNDAFGGQHFVAEPDRVSAGLDAFRRPHRLVTADDFQRALVGDFNEYQAMAGRVRAQLGGLPPVAVEERVARASALMNRRPPLLDEEVPGHVTVMVVQRLSDAEQALWDDPAQPLATKQALLGLATPDPLDPLRRRIMAFLDERRLITTHVAVVAPAVVGVQIDLSVVVDAHRYTSDMEAAVRSAVVSHLSVLRGGRDGRGWPVGRPVYRSEILSVVERLPGVDHVPTLTLTPATPDGDFDVGPRELPVITALNVVAVRA